MDFRLITPRLSNFTVTTLLLVGAAQFAAPSYARAAACTTSINACGCTITSGGLSTPYNIANDLVFTPTSGDCIDIAASSVALQSRGHYADSRRPVVHQYAQVGFVGHRRKTVWRRPSS